MQPSPVPAPPVPPAPAPAKAGNGLATAGFILGLLGFLGSFIPVLNIGGIILGIVGAALAGVGLSKAKKVGAGRGLAISGIILGALALVIGIAINVAFANAVDEATDTVVDAPADQDDKAAADDQASTDDQAAAEDEEAVAAGDALGTTRDNPAPLGSAIAYGDWTVTINSVTTADVDSFGQAPVAGMTLLVVNMTATYSGTDAQGATSWATVSFVTADGTTIDGLDDSTLFIPENQFDSLATVYEGGSVTGDQMMEVPADTWQAGVLAVSPDVMADDTFVAVQ